MCEKSCRPLRECSGFVKTELKRVIFPRASLQIPGCRGTPRLLGKPVLIIPIGSKASELLDCELEVASATF